MVLIGETEVVGEEPVNSATLSTTNVTWTSMGSHEGLCGERKASDCLSCGLPLNTTINPNCIYKYSVRTAQ
jgi:hypothetical protein